MPTGRATFCGLMEREEHFTLGHDAFPAILLKFPVRNSDVIFLVCFIDWINQRRHTLRVAELASFH